MKKLTLALLASACFIGSAHAQQNNVPPVGCAGVYGQTTCAVPVATIIGTVTTDGTTARTFGPSDCGTTVRFTNSSAITATVPSTLPVGCTIAVEQAGTAKVTVSAGAGATLHNAHSYTGTSGQWAFLNLVEESSAVTVMTGDGS